MISLIHYNEYGPGMGFPSMKDSFEETKYFGQDRIAAYLINGRKTYAAAGRSRDFFTGEEIPGELCGMTDEEYSWISDLSYYVKTYNLRLPKEFEDKVLSMKGPAI